MGWLHAKGFVGDTCNVEHREDGSFCSLSLHLQRARLLRSWVIQKSCPMTSIPLHVPRKVAFSDDLTHVFLLMSTMCFLFQSRCLTCAEQHAETDATAPCKAIQEARRIEDRTARGRGLRCGFSCKWASKLLMGPFKIPNIDNIQIKRLNEHRHKSSQLSKFLKVHVSTLSYSE